MSASTVPGEIANREGLADFVVRWRWADQPLAPGLTAVMRVKNEALNLPHVLPPLLRAVRAVVLVDNGSADRTSEIAREVAEHHNAADRLSVHTYPFDVSRCGPDHLHTPADSVHSLTHFYNWSFSHVRTAYALKWDGDMVPTARGEQMLRDLEWQLEGQERALYVRHRPLYVRDDRTAYVDTELRLPEPTGWPNGPDHRIAKAFEWELPIWPKSTRSLLLTEWSTLEVKRLDQDEFGHWSTSDFERSTRTARKRREIAVFTALGRGETPPPGVVEINAPEGRNVIEYARDEWLRVHRRALDELARETGADPGSDLAD